MVALVHKDDNYESPDFIIFDIESKSKLKISFDAAATEKNKICDDYYSKEDNALEQSWLIFDGKGHKKVVYCNPPRSKNGKFARKAHDEWYNNNINIFLLLTWNDFGNKYGQGIIKLWKEDLIHIENLGKVVFNKKGKRSDWPSRLNYCWVWFKERQ